MSTPLTNGTPSNNRQRRGPRYQKVGDKPTTAAGSLRDEAAIDEFKAHTKGLSQRLPMASVEAMRAGSVLSPHAMVRRYLLSARGIGLPKEWAVRFALWVQRQVDALWPMEQTTLQALEQRAMALESADNAAEKCHDLHKDLESLRLRLSTQMAELAADQLVAAKLQRRLEDLEACK